MEETWALYPVNRLCAKVTLPRAKRVILAVDLVRLQGWALPPVRIGEPANMALLKLSLCFHRALQRWSQEMRKVRWK